MSSPLRMKRCSPSRMRVAIDSREMTVMAGGKRFRRMPGQWHSRLTEELYLLFSSLPPFIFLHFNPLFFLFFSFFLRVAMSNPFADVPPPLPPKQTAPSRRQQHQSHPPRSNTRTDPSHTHHPSRSTDTPSRTRPNRSQTTGPPYVISLSLLLPSRSFSSLDQSNRCQHHVSPSGSAGQTFPFFRLGSIR